ncbi:hypothetical protein OA90_25490 [Labrenzia sp. OB1]|nr:hypothetical protein OA90_25490 [Labrenzia sp. OB1]
MQLCHEGAADAYDQRAFLAVSGVCIGAGWVLFIRNVSLLFMSSHLIFSMSPGSLRSFMNMSRRSAMPV